MTGGAKDDTIYAAADDVVNFSGGNDFIRFDHITREWRINGNIGGVTININSGNISADTTVRGFDTSLDNINLNDIDNLSFDFNSGNLQIAANKSSLTFENITDTTTLLINDDAAAFIAEGSTIAVTDDTISSFYGVGYAAIDYSNCNDTLDVNLNDYSSINTVKGGRSNTIIWGNDAKSDAIYAGSGESAIYGGFGSAGDTLFGYSGDDKTGSATFFMLEGSGSDTIYDFAFGADRTADKLSTFGQTMTDIIISGDDIAYQVGSNSKDRVTIKNAKNKVTQVNFSGKDLVVEFGDDLTYNDVVNFYGDHSATKLKVDSDYSGDKVEIWTNGSDGKFYNNVKDIDAGDYSGQAVLVGNALENVITASEGRSTLWGGAGSDDDTLIGSEGYNEFFYLKGNGNDVIKYAKSTDLINLLDINLENISSADFDGLELKLNFKIGGSLSMVSLSNLTFQLADGNKYNSYQLIKALK